jgi:hypothetical protein
MTLPALGLHVTYHDQTGDHLAVVTASEYLNDGTKDHEHTTVFVYDYVKSFVGVQENKSDDKYYGYSPLNVSRPAKVTAKE